MVRPKTVMALHYLGYFGLMATTWLLLTLGSAVPWLRKPLMALSAAAAVLLAALGFKIAFGGGYGGGQEEAEA